MVEVLSNSLVSFINVIFTLVGYSVNVVLSPINLLILSYLPDTSWISSINSFFSSLTQYANWFLSFTGIEQVYFNIVIVMWIFILSVPLLVAGVKLAVKWFSYLKIG